jgi:hypothetical protein
MTRADALREAARRWPDVPVFAARVSDPEPARRCVVGIVGVSGANLPCGAGRTFEAAFAQATELGIDAERVKQTRENMARVTVGGDDLDHRLALAAAEEARIRFPDGIGGVPWTREPPLGRRLEQPVLIRSST